LLTSRARAVCAQGPRTSATRDPGPTGRLGTARRIDRQDRNEGFTPIPVDRLELAGDSPVPEPNRNGQIHLLVTLHGVPLGTCWELPATTTSSDVRQTLAEWFAEPLHAHLSADGLTIADLRSSLGQTEHRCHLAPAVSDELVSVVIATLGREPKLFEAVRSVLAQSHRNLELIVVDNDPGQGSARLGLDGLDDPRLRILAEPQRGTSFARNSGLRSARGKIAAFVDDDVIADQDWLRRLIVPFEADREVNCVTGLVLPARLDTQAQTWFEEYGAFDKGFTRLVWSLDDRNLTIPGTPGARDALFPYSAGVYGSGNNMAFRRNALLELGGFDPALGGGALTRGGEDLDVFLGVILAGGALVYEPPAMVRHYARTAMPELEHQVFGYGSGMCAVILKQLWDGDRSARPLLRRIPAGLRRLLDPRSSKNARKTSDYPRRLTLIELSGYAAAPWLYLRSRRRRRLSGRRELLS
jgi:glycosyltransferase involved in cell wall biosynthesis